MIQYFNKDLLSGWTSDSRAEGWKMTILQTVSLPETLVLPSGWLVRTAVIFHDMPTAPSPGWCWILGRNMCLGDRPIVPSPAFLVWGERCCPRFKDPRGSGSKHTFFWGVCGLEDGYSEFHKKAPGNAALKNDVQDFLRADRSRNRGDSSGEAFSCDW